jgi:hypothetical protein
MRRIGSALQSPYKPAAEAGLASQQYNGCMEQGLLFRATQSCHRMNQSRSSKRREDAEDLRVCAGNQSERADAVDVTVITPSAEAPAITPPAVSAITMETAEAMMEATEAAMKTAAPGRSGGRREGRKSESAGRDKGENDFAKHTVSPVSAKDEIFRHPKNWYFELMARFVVTCHRA